MSNEALPIVTIEYYDFRELLQDKFSKKDTARIVELLSPPVELLEKAHKKDCLSYPFYKNKNDKDEYCISINDILLPDQYKKIVYKKMGRQIKKVCSSWEIVGIRLLITIAALCKVRGFTEFIYEGPTDDPEVNLTGFIAVQTLKSPSFEYEDPRYDPKTGDIKMKCKIIEDLSGWPLIKDSIPMELKRINDRTDDE